MSTLENCTDALLQQKVVQASNYERLESRLMEMERTKRSLFFGLKEIITDVGRRRQDLGELREESVRLQQQLQQGSIRFGVLVAFMGEEQKKSLRLQEALEGCATAWAGCPARVAFLIRALQERSAFCRQLADVVTALQRVRALTETVHLRDAAKNVLQDRLDQHENETERMSGLLQKLLQERKELEEDLLRRLDAAHNDGEKVWRNLQEKKRHLVVLEALSAEACLYSAAGEGRNAIHRMALQAALSISDLHFVARGQKELATRFSRWHCALVREAIADVEERTRLITDMMTDRVTRLQSERGRVVREREQAVQENTVSREVRATLCRKRTALERRVEFIQLLHSAVCVFRCQEQKRLAHISRKRAELEGIVTSTRAAHEARAFVRRLRALQEEAREGLLAEESLMRRALEGTEEDARVTFNDQQTQALLVANAKAVKYISEAKVAVTATAAYLSQKEEQRKAVAKKDVNEPFLHGLRHIGSKKAATPRRSRASNAVLHTEKKRPRSHKSLSSATVARRTYPESRQQQKKEEDISSESSTTSLGDFLTFGTRLPLSALKSTATRRPPLQQLSTNVDNSSSAGKKKEGLSKGLTETVVRRAHGNSPLPRQPLNNNTPCAVSSALSFALTRTVAAAGTADTTAAKGKGRPVPPAAPRLRPSVVVAKDAWSEGKADDVFADVFLF